ncbi:MAG: sugar phosphate nucleotidyltransferase [Eubacteriales bacterium]|nr:sugar phosphate nucleotidyltransferase [Eubacteriales bacterium]
MNIILLSGGSGKRLWPLSNDVRSKQFIKIFKENNEYISMLQRVYGQIKSADENAEITIATGRRQVSAIHNQLSGRVSVCVEPCRRDTFPAIALASSYLHYEKGVGIDEAVAVCPVDPYVESAYFEAVKQLTLLAQSGTSRLCLMGVEPTYPSEKYGYIIPQNKENVSPVQSFREKPDVEAAKEYISKGALWNCGVFAFKIGYLLDIAHKLIDFTDYKDLREKYETLKKISFDYAVAEKETDISVLRYSGEWKDLGTWNTFSEVMSEPSIGKAVLDDKCKNTSVINSTDLPLLCMGCENLIITASNDGILVSDKAQSSYIKPYVDRIEEPVRFAEKSWGSYTVIDVLPESMTVRVTLNKGHMMNYHSHERRDEVWTVVSGKGITIVDGAEKRVGVGDVITMPAKSRHTIIAETELRVIEVQIGKDIDVQDKIKYDIDFRR